MTLPQAFETSTRRLLGPDRWQRYMEALREPPVASIRLNRAKLRQDERPTAAWDGAVPWCQDGGYLKGRSAFTFDPLLHAGVYYVQEAASMFLDRVLRQYVAEPVCMLDLCAAPGGKSTVARAALPEGSLLVSNEPVRQRCQVLVENMMKWGHPDVIVTNNLPRDFSRSGLMFDVILTDVPCSGEGMFRKDEGAVGEWSEQNVEQCRQLQRQIVAEAWECLRPGGLLIYSTCTLNTRENEENILHFVGQWKAEPLAVNIADDWGIIGSLLPEASIPVYRFIPGFAKGEGLFMAVLRKPASAGEEATARDMNEKPGSSKRNARRGQKAAANSPYPTPLPIIDGWRYDICEQGGRISAFTKAWSGTREMTEKRLRVVHEGVALGERKGRDIVPHPSLALSTALLSDAFPQAELSLTDAISYLRREAIVLPADVPKGYVVVSFGHHPLGFVKNLGNRANNLYPQEWRIRSTHLPEGTEPIIEKLKN